MDCDILTGGVRATIFSKSSEGDHGGDIYYFSVCQNDFVTRIAVADLRGHGSEVSTLSQWIYDLLSANMNTPNNNEILSSLNQLLFERGVSALTTAAVLAFYTQDSQLYFSYAGHPTPFLKRNCESTRKPLFSTETTSLSNGLLGAFAAATYDEAVTPLQSGDRLILYTDGVTERFSADFEEFGEERLRQVLQAAFDGELSTVKRSLLTAMESHANGMPQQDDMTLLILEVL
ncbi:MAG: PP2C family protein-serine/threonine phosphatase [Acidobacteriaceae bacterium]